MKSLKIALLAATLGCAITTAEAEEITTELTDADQCMIEAYRDIINRYAQTTDIHEIEIAPLQEKCEADTGSVVQHADLLKKGLSNWAAGGTRFLFK